MSCQDEPAQDEPRLRVGSNGGFLDALVSTPIEPFMHTLSRLEIVFWPWGADAGRPGRVLPWPMADDVARG
eukprot:2733971-Prymnesium_polylepis.1